MLPCHNSGYCRHKGGQKGHFLLNFWVGYRYLGLFWVHFALASTFDH